MFLEPFGAGAVLLLTLLLVISTIIALLHSKTIKTPRDFLVAGHRATWYDFAGSQIAYSVGVGSVVIFFPSLSYTYGPIAIPIVLFAWLLSLIVFGGVLAKSAELKSFLKTDFGLPNFISGNFSHGLGREFVRVASCLILALVYWGLFGFEMVALKAILGEMFPGLSIWPILVLAFLLVILYVGLGGYLGTMRTDGFQTLVFMVVICFIGFVVMPEQFGSVHTLPKLSSIALFSKNPNVSVGDVWFFFAMYLILGFAYAISSQDQWSRASAVAQGPGGARLAHRNTYIGLAVSVIAFIPSVAILSMGLWMFQLDPSLSAPADLETIPARLINLMAGKAPVGLLIPTLIAIAISTADTALITSIQAISSMSTRVRNSVVSCRTATVVLGLIGVCTAFAFPDIVSGVFALISLPVAFVPLIIARILKRGRKAWVAVTALVSGAVIGLGAGLMGGDVALAAPLFVLVIPIVLYLSLHLLPIGRE